MLRNYEKATDFGLSSQFLKDQLTSAKKWLLRRSELKSSTSYNHPLHICHINGTKILGQGPALQQPELLTFPHLQPRMFGHYKKSLRGFWGKFTSNSGPIIHVQSDAMHRV